MKLKQSTHKSDLFISNLAATGPTATERIIINQGGTSSGKTYTIIEILFCIAIREPKSVITVVGQDIPNLKKGAYRDAKNIWGDSELYQQCFGKPNETERIFTCSNGSIIEFNSYQDEQDAKSGKRDYLFVNEANGIDYKIYWQLAIRTKKNIFIDYNPTSRFWAHDIMSDKNTRVIISDHRDNIYLTQEQHDRIEGITDKELHKVYARGLTGKIDGLVYTNWQLVDEMPKDYKKRFTGIDFGFTNDPTAIIDVRLSQGELWVDEYEYQTGMLNSDIAKVIKANGISLIDTVADSAEPKSIAELRTYGIKIEGAQKGADSIKNGIDILKRYKINITKRSTNIRKEILSYKWKVDRDGNLTNEPIDNFNHSLDPLRYVALNKLNNKPVSKGIRKISY
ncbi:MAG: terminase large subunit [Paludibacter sp.]